MNKKNICMLGGIVIVLVLSLSCTNSIANLIAKTFLYPHRQPLVKNPGDYGLNYEDVSITTNDGVTLAAWLMKGSNDKVVILGHPGTFTRYGYSEEHQGFFKSGYKRDVEFIPAAKHLVEAGYSVLMYDQRNHGDSGPSPNKGIHDIANDAYLDLVAAVQYVSGHPELSNQNIGLVSFCQSAMVSMVAMSKEPEVLQEAGIKAMVAVQPIATETFYRQFGVPEFILKDVRQIFLDEGATAIETHTPLPYAKDVFVPVLFVQNINDPWSDVDESKTIYNAIPTEKSALWLDENDKHRFLAYNWFNDNPEPLISFMNTYVGE